MGSSSFKLGVLAYWGVFDTFHQFLLRPSLPVFSQSPSSRFSVGAEGQVSDVPPSGEPCDPEPDWEEHEAEPPDSPERLDEGEEALRPRWRQAYVPLPYPPTSYRTRSRTTLIDTAYPRPTLAPDQALD